MTTKKGIKTTVQAVKGKYTVPVPSAIVKLTEIEKGNKFIWKIDTGKITIEIERSKK
jgi:hypothetical protein